MKVKVLGCSGGIGAGLRTTSLLIDGEVLIDAGTGVGDLPLSELRRIRTVFMTHTHLDHVACLPLLVDTIFDQLTEPLVVHGRAETIEALRTHVFNWVMWPDFTVLPTATKPCMRLQTIVPGKRVTAGVRSFLPIEMNHTVPTIGYIVECGGKTFAFTADTAANDAFWAAVNALPKLDLLIVETAFANANEELAWISRHYCPKSLAADLRKLKHDVDVHITHLKPGAEDPIFEEIRSFIPERRFVRLKGGEEFDL
jgi:cAMP phosphodiesterase